MPRPTKKKKTAVSNSHKKPVPSRKIKLEGNDIFIVKFLHNRRNLDLQFPLPRPWVIVLPPLHSLQSQQISAIHSGNNVIIMIA